MRIQPLETIAVKMLTVSSQLQKRASSFVLKKKKKKKKLDTIVIVVNVLALESVLLSLEELTSRAFVTGTFTTAQITVNEIQCILR